MCNITVNKHGPEPFYNVGHKRLISALQMLRTRSLRSYLCLMDDRVVNLLGDPLYARTPGRPITFGFESP